MNYFISTTYKLNRYHAVKITSLAIVCQDDRELFIENKSIYKIAKAVKRFTSDGTERKFYCYGNGIEFMSFASIFKNQLPENYPPYLRDLKFLYDYVSEKVGNGFGANEDSNYPFPDENLTPLQTAKWMQRLHSFLIQFDAKTR